MHAPKTILAAAALFVASACAGCYSGGAKWPDKFDATKKAEEVCAGWTSVGGGQTLSACRNGPNNIRYNFDLYNSGAGVRSIDGTFCREKLIAEIRGCDRGGASTYGEFTF